MNNLTYTAALVALLAAAPARAGLYLSGRAVPRAAGRLAGFLPDHRALRQAAAGAGRRRCGTLTPTPPGGSTTARARPLTADEAADLGRAATSASAEPRKAVEVLRPAARAHPDHFRTAANLGTAWQLAGDLEQAAAALEEAVRLAPEPLQAGRGAAPEARPPPRLRRARPRRTPRTTCSAPTPRAGATPAIAALAQRLALWLPADGRLLWQLGGTRQRLGDVRTAANILDGCVTEFGMSPPTLRDHRQRVPGRGRRRGQGRRPRRAAGAIRFKSARPLARGFDPARLPAVNPAGVNPLPWPALAETEIGRGFKPAFLKYVEQLDGKRVAIAGHMAPAGGRGGDADGFLLTETPVGCWFCDKPGPTQVVAVELPAGATVEVARGAVKVTGTLRAEPDRPGAVPVHDHGRGRGGGGLALQQEFDDRVKPELVEQVPNRVPLLW